ncbi:DciA family protein [Massilia sp. TS11]|uniref:DciA family protein n=1 Tax=Massilia sp. TS11 TaxID=2908003 RepID=UPI001EDC82E8|nr:DciA family protein [Massilia sp. TS11]MCG2585312.1 DUF721 domain-containing protein [Massilia sp. TS11]
MSQRPYTIFGTRDKPTAFGASHFLRGDARLARLLPAAERMARLQRDVAAVLPQLAQLAAVLSFESGCLVLAVPNAAVAAKLKQQTLKLQQALGQRGWAVEQVRLKVQVMPPPAPETRAGSLELSPAAVRAFDELAHTLEPSAQNATLIGALQRLTARRQGRG